MVEFKEPFATLWCGKDSFEEVKTLQGEIFHELETRRTLHFEVASKGCLLKWHRDTTLKEIIKNSLSSWMPVLNADREWNAIHRLRDVGVDAMYRVASGEKGINPPARISFIITEDLIPTISPEDYYADRAASPPDARIRRMLIKRVATMMRSMHAAGINHRDCYICHFLLHLPFSGKEEVLKISVTDLHRAQIRAKVPRRWRDKDLIGLYFSSINIGLTQQDVWRFMKVYFAASLKDIIKQEQELLLQAEEKATKIRKRTIRKPLQLPEGDMSTHYSNPQEMIDKTIILDESPEASVASPSHVAYGIDQNFLFSCGVSITSVLLHSNDVNLVFHVFVDDIPKADIQHLSQLAKNYHIYIRIHLVSCKRLRALPMTKSWSIAVYFRFTIASHFIDRQNKILYLGADIACQGNLKPLITMDLADNVAAVVTERDANRWSLRGQSLQCNEPEKGYFNSGVLLISTLTWAQESVPAKAMSVLTNKIIVSRLVYMDQDILNLILLGKVKFIDAKYNTQFSLNCELKKSFVCPTNDETVLIHYVGSIKPWHYWAGYPGARPFIEAKEALP